MLKKSDENIYVFFTKTGKENDAANDIRRSVSEYDIAPLDYSVEIYFKRKGEIHKEIRPVFPGYLFVASSLYDEEFILKTRKCVKESQYIIRLLQYGNSSIAAVNKEEREMLKSVLQENTCIRASKGYIKENRLVITGGPFKGKENFIKSIDRHKRQAVLEISIMGEVRKVIVGLEIKEKYIHL